MFSRSSDWYRVSVAMPYRVMVTERLRSSQSEGMVWPSHWMSQPADSAATRRFSTSQPANSTYSGWRLIRAVIRMNRASTIMPPSSRPDLRWYCSTESWCCSAGHCRTDRRAGPEKSARHSSSGGSGFSVRAKPAFDASMAPCPAPRVALPSGARLAASQQATSSA